MRLLSCSPFDLCWFSLPRPPEPSLPGPGTEPGGWELHQCQLHPGELLAGKWVLCPETPPPGHLPAQLGTWCPGSNPMSCRNRTPGCTEQTLVLAGRPGLLCPWPPTPASLSTESGPGHPSPRLPGLQPTEAPGPFPPLCLGCSRQPLVLAGGLSQGIKEPEARRPGGLHT